MRNQLIVGALFHNPAAFEHINPVGMHDCGEPMRDQNRDRIGALAHPADCPRNLFFCQ